MRKTLSTIFLVICAAVGAHYYRANEAATPASVPADHVERTRGSDGSAIARAWQERRSNVQVRDRGIVTRMLADDNDGSRHQRFVLELDSGQTVLIAHNIDLAPRIDALRTGDLVSFYGEYEWNAQGGVVHWTHLDPAGRHVDGWLEHAGRRYQ